MTPYELDLHVKVHQEMKKEKAENDISIAYYTAYFHRVEKLKPLKEYLDKKPVKKKMSDKQMYEQVKMLNAAFGGEVIESS